MDALENEFVRNYPNTCEECPERGELKIFGAHFSGDIVQLYDADYAEKRWKSIGWPVRCKPCNAKAQAKKRANRTIHRLEELRQMTQDTFSGLKSAEDRWCYLKFVTLTWESSWGINEIPNMKRAKKWLGKRRVKVIEKLDVLGGTDVLECVTKTIYGYEKGHWSYQQPVEWKHNIHSHGVWLMPYHPIEFIGDVMRKHVGRDETRAIKPKIVKCKKTGREFTVSAFAQARNYIMKYLSKQPNTRRSSWGIVRKSLTAEYFYSECIRISEKWAVPS